MRRNNSKPFKSGDEVTWPAAVGQGADIPAILLGPNHKVKHIVNVEDANGKLFTVHFNELIHFDSRKHKQLVKNFADALSLIRKNMDLANEIGCLSLDKMSEFNNFKSAIYNLVELNSKCSEEEEEEEDWSYEDIEDDGIDY